MTNDVENNTLNADVLLTAMEVASILRISPLTLTKWRNSSNPRIACFKIGRRYVYKAIDVKKYIESIQK